MLLQEYWNRMGGYHGKFHLCRREIRPPELFAEVHNVRVRWDDIIEGHGHTYKDRNRELLATLLTWETLPSNKQAWAKLWLYGPTLEEKWIPFTGGWCMPSDMVLHLNKLQLHHTWWSVPFLNLFLLFDYYLPLGKTMTLHLAKMEF